MKINNPLNFTNITWSTQSNISYVLYNNFEELPYITNYDLYPLPVCENSLYREHTLNLSCQLPQLNATVVYYFQIKQNSQGSSSDVNLAYCDIPSFIKYDSTG